jgi:peptide deformylase
MKIILVLLALISFSAFASERLEIIKIGHPTLRAQPQAQPLSELENPLFQKLIDDMIYTMKVSSGVGLAAPQVNQSLRLFVMGAFGVPLTVVINPKIEYRESEGLQESIEGCLSIPGKRVKVKRFKTLFLSYFDRKGNYISKELSGFAAIIAQHEYDHLNGILITDLIEQINDVSNYIGFSDVPLM